MCCHTWLFTWALEIPTQVLTFAQHILYLPVLPPSCIALLSTDKVILHVYGVRCDVSVCEPCATMRWRPPAYPSADVIIFLRQPH